MKDFVQRYTLLDAKPTSLPFVVGGLTQPGLTGHGSQDALAAASGKDYLAGIVCDGCAGATGTAGLSMNEAGAHITAAIMINALRLGIRKADTPDDLLFAADRYLGSRLRSILKLLLPQTPSQSEEEHIAFNLLAATITGFVITPEFWTVFHYGDGICGVNGHIEALEASSGKYYIASNIRWRNRRRHVFSVYAQGETKDLHSLIIGSDGMMDLMDGPELGDFLTLSDRWEYERGICDTMDFTREFRVRVSRPFMKRSEMTGWDDRTAIIVRRLGE